MSDGWYPDPYNRFELRYFGNGIWTEHVSTNGTTGSDPTSDSVSTNPDGDVETWWTSKRSAGVYLGSHPSRPGRVEELGLGFLSLGFGAADGKQQLVITIAWRDIQHVTVETADSIQSRITATRVLLFGAIGLLAKKTTRTAFVTIRDGGGEWVFAVEDQDAAGLWSQLQPVKARMPDKFSFGARPEQQLAAPTVAAIAPKERLQSLDQLRADGILTETEWAQRRAEIIASL